jgi:hypothetical protein
MAEEVTGREIIQHIVDAMVEYAQPLKYSTLVPGLYQIYLRPDDYERLEPLFPRIKQETRRGLDEKLASLNKYSRFRLKRKPPHENLLTDWYIEFQVDEDEEQIPAGEPFAVDVQIALPEEPEYGFGTKTISLKTVRMSQGTPKTIKTTAEQIFAKITYPDPSGTQEYLMTKKQIVLGRGGKAHWVDLKLDTVDDVSRNHLRVRYDDQRRAFFAKDISLYGTTMNGTKLPSSLETTDGVTRETDLETQIPQTARFVLADKLYLDFKAEVNL